MAASQQEQDVGRSPSEIYRLLKESYGDLGWWPADGPFEVMVGAVLTQRTAWRNVEIALHRLKEAGVRDMASLIALPEGQLETLIRPSGTYRQKAQGLRDLFQVVNRVGKGSLDAFLDRPSEHLRKDLLSIRGIGPETADSIILYAARRPVFIVDAYTRRVLARLNIEPGRSYDDVARWFTEGLPEDVDLYRNFHAVLVELSKEHCRNGPRCDRCPLLEVCPTGQGAPG